MTTQVDDECSTGRSARDIKRLLYLLVPFCRIPFFSSFNLLHDHCGRSFSGYRLRHVLSLFES